MAAKKKKMTLEERYSDLKEIGKGGMATVYKAIDTQLDRPVAIKIIQAQFIKDTKFKNRFEREAKALAKLRHQNIVPIYDYSSSKKELYYVMAYIEGKTLRNLIDEKSLNHGLIKEIALSISSALLFAHKNKIIHRDIKSENIFIDSDNNIFLGDFGIVSFLERDNEPQLTQQGSFLGTPAYASPEQIEGAELTPVSDIYSLGVVFYEMLTGQLPFTGNLNAMISGHLTKDAGKIDDSKIHPSLKNMKSLIEKMLSKKPEDRPQSCKDVLDSLKKKKVELGIEDFGTDEDVRDEVTEQKETISAAEVDETDELPMVKELNLKSRELEEVSLLLNQLRSNRKEINRKSYLELEEKYEDRIKNLSDHIKKHKQNVRTRITEVNLMLKTTIGNVSDFRQKTIELDNLKAMAAINEEEFGNRKSDFTEKIMEGESSQVTLEKELELLKKTYEIDPGHIKSARRFSLIQMAYILVFVFTGYFLWYTAYGSITLKQGLLKFPAVQIRKNHSLDSPIINIGTKNEKTAVYSKYTGDSKNEAIITKKTYIAAGSGYSLLERGRLVKIEKENENDFLVSFTEKKKIITGVMNKGTARRNLWYFIETESGREGWVFADDLSMRSKVSLPKRILLSMRRFFLFGKSAPKISIVQNKDDDKGIFGNLENKISVIVKRGSFYNSRNLTFTYYLDFQGAASIDKAIAKSLQNTRDSNNAEREKNIKHIKDKFFSGAFRNASDMIKSVSIVGSFNQWDYKKDLLKLVKTNAYSIYTVTKQWKFLKDTSEYMFVFSLKDKDKKIHRIWVADPMALKTGKDEIFGTKSYFKIKPFPRYNWRKFLPNEIKASSSAPGNDTLNLVDGKPQTCWTTGSDSGGINESLTLKFSYKRNIRQIGIINGHVKKAVYPSFNRVESVTLVFDDGAEKFNLRDFVGGFQYFMLKKTHYSQTVKLVINSVYPGKNTSSASISELVFY